MMMPENRWINTISLAALTVSLSWAGARTAMAGSAYVINSRTGRSVRYVQAQQTQDQAPDARNQKPADANRKDQRRSMQRDDELPPQAGADAGSDKAARMRDDRTNTPGASRQANRRRANRAVHPHHRRGVRPGQRSEVQPELRLIYRRPLTSLYLDTQSTRLVDYRRALESGVVIRRESPAYIVNGQSRRQVHGHTRQGSQGARGYGQRGSQGSRYAAGVYVPRLRFTDLHSPRRFERRGVIRPSRPISRFHEPIVPAGGRDFRSVIRRQRRQNLGTPVRPARVIQSPDHDRVEKPQSNHDIEPIMVIPKPRQTPPNIIKAPSSPSNTAQTRIVSRR